MVPDFFSDEYYERALVALRRLDGITLSNLRVGPVFNALFCEVFSGELMVRSEKLTEDVKDFMQDTLTNLCKHFCMAHPVLLNELTTNLVEQYMDMKEAATRTAVETFIRTQLGWVFTQDRSYEDILRRTNEMINAVRDSRVADNGCHAEAVGDVPAEFIAKMINCKATSEEDIVRHVQVRRTVLLQEKESAMSGSLN